MSFMSGKPALYGAGQQGWPAMAHVMIGQWLSSQADTKAETWLGSRDSAAGYNIRAASANESAFQAPIAVELAKALKHTWSISDRELALVLGIKPATSRSLFDVLGDTDQPGDRRERLNLLFDVRARLSALFDDLNVERQWLRAGNPVLGDRSPLDLLQTGRLRDLFKVEQLVFFLTGS